MTSGVLNPLFWRISYSSGMDIIQSHTKACISGQWSADVSHVFLRSTRREASYDYITRNLVLFSQSRRKKRKRCVGIWESVDSAVAGHGQLGTRNGGAGALDGNLNRHCHICPQNMGLICMAVQPLRCRIIFLSLSFTKLGLVYDMVEG